MRSTFGKLVTAGAALALAGCGASAAAASRTASAGAVQAPAADRRDCAMEPTPLPLLPALGDGAPLFAEELEAVRARLAPRLEDGWRALLRCEGASEPCTVVLRRDVGSDGSWQLEGGSGETMGRVELVRSSAAVSVRSGADPRAWLEAADAALEATPSLARYSWVGACEGAPPPDRGWGAAMPASEPAWVAVRAARRVPGTELGADAERAFASVRAAIAGCDVASSSQADLLLATDAGGTIVRCEARTDERALGACACAALDRHAMGTATAERWLLSLVWLARPAAAPAPGECEGIDGTPCRAGASCASSEAVCLCEEAPPRCPVLHGAPRHNSSPLAEPPPARAMVCRPRMCPRRPPQQGSPCRQVGLRCRYGSSGMHACVQDAGGRARFQVEPVAAPACPPPPS
ncbi:MAG: hypothetical protein HYY06_28240 [Deltaproteobacteria bacterium]|nr:hypothetical protein [Deltaproteobacteria bacterium]